MVHFFLRHLLHCYYSSHTGVTGVRDAIAVPSVIGRSHLELQAYASRDQSLSGVDLHSNEQIPKTKCPLLLRNKVQTLMLAVVFCDVCYYRRYHNFHKRCGRDPR